MANDPAAKKREPSPPIGINDAVQFWQREVYYYEGRAGEQGASASRMVTVAAGTTAVLPLLVNTVDLKSVVLGFDIRLVLLVVPVLMFLLWTSAIRLLHEMHLLRVYVQRAELQLKKLTDEQRTLKGYTRWADHGLAHDFSYYVMLVWFFAALILSIGGTFGITYMVVNLVSPERMGLAMGVLVVAATILVFSFIDTRNDAKGITHDFENEGPEPVPTQAPRWVVIAGLVSSGLLVVAAPLAVWCLNSNGVQQVYVSWVLAAFLEVIAVVGAVAGGFSGSSAVRSIGRTASKTLVFVAFAGSIACVIYSIAGGPGL